MNTCGIWIALCCGAVSTVLPANETDMAFRKNERIVFLGDSITHEGSYLYDILLFEVLRHPDIPLRFINAGFSGDSAAGGLQRLQSDVLNSNPTCVFILFGMNDVGRHLYTGKTDSAVMKARDGALENYRRNMTAIVERLLAAGRRVVLITPTPYDEYNSMPDTNCTGANEQGLAECARMIRNLAEDKKIGMVDFHAELTAILRNHPSISFTRDRVHPLPPGHLVMAAIFLKKTGETPLTASVSADMKTGILRTENASVENVKIHADGVSFDYSPHALPFPVDGTYLEAEKFYPVTRTLNQEILCVSGLRKGEYTLTADGKSLGAFSASALSRGINLALLKTPSAETAGKFLFTVSQIAGLERKLRGIALLRQKVLQGKEYGSFAQEYAALDAYLQTIRTMPWHRYYSGLAEQYKEDRPHEEKIKKMLEQYYQTLYRKEKRTAYPIRIARIDP